MNTLFGTAETGEGGDRDAALMAAYAAAGRTLDDLPYTPEFEQVYSAAGGEGVWGSRKEAFRRLHNLRKRGVLPRLGRSGVSAVKVTEADEALVCRRVVGAVGSLGQRDQLPFDEQLDRLSEEFAWPRWPSRTGRTLRASP